MTLKYYYKQDGIVARFVARLIPHCRGFGAYRAIGILNKQDELIAGAVYHNFIPEAGVIEGSAAALPGHRWVTRQTLQVLYDFPFRICRCQMVRHVVRGSDLRSQRALAAVGCMHVTIPRLFGRNEDGVYCLLTVEAWTSSRFNKPITKLEEAA
jgi:hypothetical protein